jgi:hypothetical protein
LDQIDGFLRQAAAGRPVHFSLFGVSGVGKSSLLNAAVAIAAERRLLPIRLCLRKATCESELAFYGAFFEAGLHTLLEKGTLKADSELMVSWLRQTGSGELEIDSKHQPLEIGLVLAADLNGKFVRRIQIPSLMRDISRLLALAGDLRGIALCIDSAEHLDDSPDIAESLLELIDADPRLVLITAAPQAGRLQTAASRTWAQIEVGPFQTPLEVFEAMTRPLESADRSSVALDPAAAEDIHKLTRGQPYEVNLVCHFIWEAIQSQRQTDFQLSDAVIERVLGEFIERGRHESSADIALVAGLSARDYELLTKLAPYENLTIKEIALTRLMPKEFEDQRLVELEASIRMELQTLAQREVLNVQDDRFCLVVSEDARLYLRYAAERHTGERLDYGQTYTQQVTRACREDFGRALAGEESEAAHLFAVWQPHEIGASQAGSWLNELREAVAAGDIATLAGVIHAPLDLGAFATNRDKGLILYSFFLRVGLQEIEHATLVTNVGGRDEQELAEEATTWVQAKREFLERYEIEIVELRCEPLGAKLAACVVAYAHIERLRSLVMSLYAARQIQAAQKLCSGTINLAEALVGTESVDPLMQAKLADAYNRLGFMFASGEQLQEALDAFAHSEQLNLERQWVTIYNTAYVKARMRRFDEAASLVRAAIDAIGDEERDMILHADIPAPADWQHSIPWIRVVQIPAAWLGCFLNLQAAVWQARADEQHIPALVVELEACTESAPLPILRLAGWAELTIAQRSTRGLRLLDLAIDATGLHEVELARSEVARLHDTPNLILDPQVEVVCDDGDSQPSGEKEIAM